MVEICTASDLEREFKKGIRLYKKFHWGTDIDKILRRKIPRIPGVTVMLGDLPGIPYITQKEGDDEPIMYYHEFETELPLLVTSAAGRGLWIVGGKFRTKAEGIVG